MPVVDGNKSKLTDKKLQLIRTNLKFVGKLERTYPNATCRSLNKGNDCGIPLLILNKDAFKKVSEVTETGVPPSKVREGEVKVKSIELNPRNCCFINASRYNGEGDVTIDGQGREIYNQGYSE